MRMFLQNLSVLKPPVSSISRVSLSVFNTYSDPLPLNYPTLFFVKFEAGEL